MGEQYRPGPDSQFRLLPCDCGSKDVVYQSCSSIRGTEYQVKCLTCGRRSQWMPCRHDAQGVWNEMARRKG